MRSAKAIVDSLGVVNQAEMFKSGSLGTMRPGNMIKNALEWYALRHPMGHLFIKCNGRYERIEHSQIQWLKAANNYVWIHTGQKKYMVYQSLKALEDQLPRELFAQTHKSFIVGKQHIRQVHANTVCLPGVEVPLSRRYRAGFLQQLQLTRNFPPVG